MAIQHGPVKFTGQLGGMSFYMRNGEYYVRMKTCHSKERIQNDPAFEKTHQCSTDFGAASRASKLLRSPLAHVLAHVADKEMVSRLTGRFVKVIRGDSRHEAGQREVNDGDLNVLKRFEFNTHKAFHNAFTASYKVTVSPPHKEVTLYVPTFDTHSGIASPPAGATHARVFAAVICLDFKNGSQVSTRYTSYLDVHSRQQPYLELVNTIEGKTGDVMIVALGIEFYQTVNGDMMPLLQGGAMMIAEAGKVGKSTDRSPQSKVKCTSYEMFHRERQVSVKTADFENCRQAPAFSKRAELVVHGPPPGVGKGVTLEAPS